jgi:hypothetical protein
MYDKSAIELGDPVNDNGFQHPFVLRGVDRLYGLHKEDDTGLVVPDNNAVLHEVCAAEEDVVFNGPMHN